MTHRDQVFRRLPNPLTLNKRRCVVTVVTVLDAVARSGDVDTAVPIDTTANLLYSLFCSTVLYIAASDDPDTAAHEAEHVIFAMLRGLRADTAGSDDRAQPQKRGKVEHR